MRDKTLFSNNFLAIIDRDGYTFLREVRCDGTIVAVLPYRRRAEAEWDYLARLEICPAHGAEMKRCSITGGLEAGKTVAETALLELWEEAGYQAELPELTNLGILRPSKAADTTVHLFAVDVSDKPQATPQGDGSHFEVGASVEWVTYNEGLQISDPLFVTAMARLLGSIKHQG